jgi:tetratricopeptide (TPR) repeat protein
MGMPRSDRGALSAASADQKFKAHNNLGVLYKQKGLTAQAINEYQAASKADPANPVPYKNMAILYDEQGRLPEALRNFARYLELAPNASDADVIRSRVRDLRSKTENKPAR